MIWFMSLLLCEQQAERSDMEIEINWPRWQRSLQSLDIRI